MSDSALYDLPTEFLADVEEVTGPCDAQSILPHDGEYLCHCTCGNWDVSSSTRDAGLAAARAHTTETDAQLAREEIRAGMTSGR